MKGNRNCLESQTRDSRQPARSCFFFGRCYREPFITASTKPLKLGLLRAMVAASSRLAISSDIRAV